MPAADQAAKPAEGAPAAAAKSPRARSTAFTTLCLLCSLIVGLLFTVKPSADRRGDVAAPSGVPQPHHAYEQSSRRRAATYKLPTERALFATEHDSDEGELPPLNNESVQECRGSIPQIGEPYFCPRQISDARLWRAEIRQHEASRRCTICGHGLFEPIFPPTLQPRWMCNKLNNTVRPITQWPIHSTEDVIVGLYSGESISYSRASACSDSWLSWFPNHYIYVSKTESAFGVKPTLSQVGLRTVEFPAGAKVEGWKNPGPGESWNAQYLQLFGLRDMAQRHPEGKWFIISGDDTMLDPQYTVRMLSEYDHTQPVWLSADTIRERIGKTMGARKLDKLDVSELQKHFPTWTHAPTFYWSTGSASWYLSGPAVRLFADSLDKFLQRVDIDTICYCPDLLTGLLLSLLGLRPTVMKRANVANPDSWGVHAMAVDSQVVDWSMTPSVVLYHYLWPRRMYGAAQRMQHAWLDRLQNTGNRRELWSFAMMLWRTHRDSLARRRRQVARLGRKAKTVVEPAGGNRRPPWLPIRLPEGCADVIPELRAMIDGSFDTLRLLQSQVVWLAKKAKFPMNTNERSGYDIPAWDPGKNSVGVDLSTPAPVSENSQSKKDVRRLQRELRYLTTAGNVPKPDGGECDSKHAELLAALRPLKSRAASRVFGLQPPQLFSGKQALLTLGSPRNAALHAALLQGRQQVLLKAAPRGPPLDLYKEAKGQAGDGGFDIIYDSAGGTRLAHRLAQLMGLLRYQGLYVAELPEACLRQGSKGGKAGKLKECDGLWMRIVNMLHRPHGAHRRDYARCGKDRGCDLPIESAHVFRGLVVMRRGAVHPLWNAEAERWRAGSIRDTSSRDNEVSSRRVDLDTDVAKLQLGLFSLRAQWDERADGCWQGRNSFLQLTRRYEADKGDHHAYWRGYGALMEPFRKAPGVRVAELGLSYGASLYVWVRWFGPDAELHSVDMTAAQFASIRKRIPKDASTRVHLHAVNSPVADWRHVDFDWEGTTRAINLVKKAEAGKGFDVIVDDAGHSPLQNAMFLHDLAPLLRPGGLYVCEDLVAGAFLNLKGTDQVRMPKAVRSRPPIQMFASAAYPIAAWLPANRPANETVCGGCDADFSSVHWWDETVVFEKAV
eukprot:TRINITY_DN10739_c0_g1_i3.p1 TRINITY_DN10739_c0_g1~~TRINITY_DN10739_c0_g1_i3.p1  ORF type:complete len:1120 (+),score=211.36 TRINITY_DN10739_c0_g1_i3:60-3419(+)